MADPPKDTDKLPPDEAERRFDQTLRNLLNTPHKPHKPAAKPSGDGATKGA